MSTDSPLPAILVPGLEGTGTLFGPFSDALGPAFAPRAVHYGDRPRSWAGHVAAVTRALDASPSAALVVGESFGGPVALAAATQRPDKVRGLVLVATFVSTPAPFLRQLSRLFRVTAAIPSPRPMRRISMRSSHCDDDVDPALLERLLDVNEPRRTGLLAHRLRLLATIDLRARLKALPCPVAYLGGTADKIVPPQRHLQTVLDARPDTWTRLLPGGPHLLLQCRAVECAELVRRFLHEHDADLRDADERDAHEPTRASQGPSIASA